MEILVYKKLVFISLIVTMISSCGATKQPQPLQPQITVPKWMPPIEKNRVVLLKDEGTFAWTYPLKRRSDFRMCPEKISVSVAVLSESNFFNDTLIERVKNSILSRCSDEHVKTIDINGQWRPNPPERNPDSYHRVKRRLGWITITQNINGEWIPKVKNGMDNKIAESLGIFQHPNELDYLLLGDREFIDKAEEFLGFKLSKHLTEAPLPHLKKEFRWLLEITEVKENSLAAKAKLKPGYFLTEVQGKDIYKGRGTFQRVTSDFVYGKVSGNLFFKFEMPRELAAKRHWSEKNVVYIEQQKIDGKVPSLATLNGHNYEGVLSQLNGRYVFDIVTTVSVLEDFIKKPILYLLSSNDRRTVEKYCNRLCIFKFSTNNPDPKVKMLYTVPLPLNKLHWFELGENETPNFVASLPPQMKVLQNIKLKDSNSLKLNKGSISISSLKPMVFWFAKKYALNCVSNKDSLVSISGRVQQINAKNYQSNVEKEIEFNYLVEPLFYEVAKASHDNYVSYTVAGALSKNFLGDYMGKGLNILFDTYRCESPEIQNVRQFLLLNSY